MPPRAVGATSAALDPSALDGEPIFFGRAPKYAVRHDHDHGAAHHTRIAADADTERVHRGAPARPTGLERQRIADLLLTAQEDERRRLGRELHDGVGSLLVSLSLGLRALQSVETREEMHTQLEGLQQLARRLISDVSRLGKGLHPGVLDDLGLAAAVEQSAADCRRAHEIDVDVVAHVGTIPTAQATAAYRVVQEALTNVGKHAGAKNVSVTLFQAGDELRLVVEDDGCGFPAAAAAPSDPGLGLRSLRERVALLGGTLTIQSDPGHGTTIAAKLPLPPTE